MPLNASKRTKKGPGGNHSLGLKIWYNNINGYITKKGSVQKIIEAINPDIFALCETKRVAGIAKDELVGYEVVESNLKQGKEGFIFGVREGTFKTVDEITDTDLKNIMTVKVEYPKSNLRVIIVHAPQETEKVEVRSEFFEEFSVQIERALCSEDNVVIVGDFNARVKDDGGSITAVNESANGKKLCEVLNKYDLKIGNFHSNTVGKWTRIQSDKFGCTQKSAIDYFIVTTKLFSCIQSMLVDEDKIFCPFREKTVKGKKKVTFSDHCSLVVDLSFETGKIRRKNGKRKVWNFNNEGYNKYLVLSREDILLHTTTSTSNTELYGQWEKEFHDILNNCFEKRTIYLHKETKLDDKNCRKARNILKEISQKGKVQREVVKGYLSRLVELESLQLAKSRAEKLKRTVSKLTIADKFSPTGYWKLKRAVKRGRRNMNGISSIRKENGVEIKGREGIIEAYKQEFSNRLSNRIPDVGWEDYVRETNEVVRRWVADVCNVVPDFTLEELKGVVKLLKNNKSPGVDTLPAELFKVAGDGVLKSLLAIFNRVKATKEIPKQWNLMKIITLYKQKGSKKDLKCYRGIFLSIAVCKIFENLIKGRADEKLNKVNILQAGSKKNRSAADSVFLLRGTVDHHKFTKRPLYITAYDFETAFDSLWLEDCLLSLNELGIEKDLLQLIYNLNKEASVTVQTPFGDTSEFTTDPIVKQGSILGPVLCSSSTAEFCGVNLGVTVGTLVLASLLYVDDIIDLSSTLSDCIESHEKAILFAKLKKLKYSAKKCFNMIINKIAGMEHPELQLGGGNCVVPTSVLTYLGDLFNEKGNNDDLIDDRVKRGTKAMISIMAMMSEIDVGEHHINVMLLLYRSLFLSTMLFNSQTWSNLRKKDIDALKVVQQKFLKRIVGVSASTSNSAIFLELGVLPIEFEIEKRQLMYLHRILHLEHNDPVYVMYENMRDLSEAGEMNWWSGVERLLIKYQLELETIQSMSKETFGACVRKAVSDASFRALYHESKGKKKTAHLSYSKLCLQPYFENLYPSQARLMFKCRTQTVDIKTHLTYKYGVDSVCRKCGQDDETYSHIVNCGSDVIEVIDLSSVTDMDNEIKRKVQQCLGRVRDFLNDNT